MAASGGERERPDAVQQNRYFTERMQKERQWQRLYPLYTQYTMNPFQPVHVVARKPMSWHDNIHEPTDDEFLNLIHHAALDPRKKYSEPQTEAQVVGWNTTPLVPLDRTDCRLYFPRRTSEITIHGYPGTQRGYQSKNWP